MVSYPGFFALKISGSFVYIDVNGQFSNAKFPIVTSLFSIFISFNGVQPAKAEPPMIVTLFGIDAPWSDVQPKKAEIPMPVTLNLSPFSSTTTLGNPIIVISVSPSIIFPFDKYWELIPLIFAVWFVES